MRILIITRDYPGKGIDAPSAGDACLALTQTGHEITVVTSEGHAPADAPVRTVSAGEYPPMLAGIDETAWLLQLNIAMFERAAVELERVPIDVVHAFGSSVAHAAVSLRRVFGVPLVVSMTPGRGDPDAEAWMGRDADRVVVASGRGAGRIEAPPGRVVVVRGGRGYATRLMSVYRDARHAGLSPVTRATPPRKRTNG
ncbi:MAG TPA: glycosyltransferase family 4 protein [Actinomycetota bacterium]|nr:glycosyltransferase family 4 protein [Actinomycetota bacterium]